MPLCDKRENADPRGRFYLRLSITDRCGLRCRYCRPADGVPLVERSKILSYEEILRFVRILDSRYGIYKIRITGGEPLVRRGVCDFIGRLDEEFDCELTLTSNGQSLAEFADELKHSGLDRINVSLPSLNADTFAMLTRGGVLRHTLEGIDAAAGAGLEPVKLNTVLLRGRNDDELAELVTCAARRGAVIRFIELMPFGCAADNYEKIFLPADEARRRLERTFDLYPLQNTAGQSSRMFEARGGGDLQCRVGFIMPRTAPFCAECTRLRLTSDGTLLGCLAADSGMNIKSLVQADNVRKRDIVKRVTEVLKDKGSSFECAGNTVMARVGG